MYVYHSWFAFHKGIPSQFEPLEVGVAVGVGVLPAVGVAVGVGVLTPVGVGVVAEVGVAVGVGPVEPKATGFFNQSTIFFRLTILTKLYDLA